VFFFPHIVRELVLLKHHVFSFRSCGWSVVPLFGSPSRRATQV